MTHSGAGRLQPAVHLFSLMRRPIRLRILCELALSPEPVPIADLIPLIGSSGAYISNQVALLRAGGLVERHRIGDRNAYSLAPNDHVRQSLKAIKLIE